MLCLRSSVILRLLSLLPVGLLGLAMTGNVLATTIEDFDTDPGWQGAGNTNGYSDFGYSNTSYAGGAAHEAGGAIVSRSNGFDWYADTDLGATYTLDDALTASGKFTVNSVDGFDGGFEVGFFKPSGTDVVFSGGIAEAIMMRIIDSSSTKVRTQLRMAASLTENVLLLDVGSDYTFNLTWNPTAIDSLHGTASLTVKTADGSEVGTLSVNHDNDGWALSAFGLTTLNFSAYRNDGASFYMDNLSYTSAVPEPSGLALLGMSFAGLLAYAWRKRRS